MTAESLKPFLAVPGNGGNHQPSTVTTFIRKTTDKTRITYIFSLILFFLFSIVMIGFLLWNTIKINGLETEVLKLKNLLDETRAHMGFDDLHDLKDFENAYDRDDLTKGSMEDVEKRGPLLRNYDDLIDFDDTTNDDDYEYEYPSDIDETNDNEMLGNIIQEYNNRRNLTVEISENPWNNKNTLAEDESTETKPTPLHFEEYIKGTETKPELNDLKPNERKPRSISATEQGVPVIDESYAMRRNPTHPVVDDYVKNILLNKNHQEPKMNYDWSHKNQASSIPRRFLKTFQQHRAAPTSYVEAPPMLEIKDHEIPMAGIREKSSRIQLKSGQVKELATTRHPVHTRDSRVMPTNEDKNRAFRQSITKSEYARLYSKQGTNDFLEQVSHPEEVVYPRRRNNRPMYKSLDGKPVIKQGGSHRGRNIAAHFIGDSSHYIEGRHKHYKGNGLLLHPGGAYFDWKSAPWVTSLNMDRFFNLESGVVTVRESGLYLIYAQIYYHDAHDLNSYFVDHNNQHLLQCVTMTHSSGHVTKSNTCHTSGVAYLIENDQIRLVDSGSERHSLFLPEKSFFGLVKLGEPRLN